jgi:hypothetical protein
MPRFYHIKVADRHFKEFVGETVAAQSFHTAQSFSAHCIRLMF